MPLYDWRCDNPECATETQVQRPMAEYEKGPDDPCEKCGSVSFTRFIAEWKPPQTQLIHGGKAPWFQETLVGRVNNGR